jgi:hypothetical protein
VDTAGDTSRWISKCGPASGTDSLSLPPPVSAGGVTGVAVSDGNAVAAGIKVSAVSGPVVAVGTDSDVAVATTAVAAAVGSPSSEELHATVRSPVKSTVTRANAYTRDLPRSAREVVFFGELIKSRRGRIDRCSPQCTERTDASRRE